MDYVSVILFYAAVILIVIFIVKTVRKRKENKEESKRHPKTDSQKELVREVIAAIERESPTFMERPSILPIIATADLFDTVPWAQGTALTQNTIIILMHTVISSVMRWHIFWPVKLLITLAAGAMEVIHLDIKIVSIMSRDRGGLR